MQGCSERSLTLVERLERPERPERPTIPNENKPGPWPVMWEYRVALSMRWLRVIMYVGSWAASVYICVCVCVFIGFDQTLRVASAAFMHHKSVIIC